ncbi:OmpA family protein [Reichenbachiella versicolor]|uniref:OmpA family protein n=1 Tax=Reichenbachiella versicolor TaxID=1821036 RepID=UPI000D6E0094|nr:OmpA family protein [Reichenbachiella versicolor]
MKTLLTTILILMCLLGTELSFAEKKQDSALSNKSFKKGVRLFNSGNFIQAEKQFQVLLDSGYRDLDLIAIQAQVHLELHAPHAAKDVILLTDERNEDLDFLLAVSHYFLEEFDEAYKELMLIKDTAAYHVDDMKRRIDYAKQHYRDYKGYVIQNFGPEVNTKYREYAAVMFHGTGELLYTTRNDSSEYTAHDGMAFETIHDTSIDSLNAWHVADPFEFHTRHEKRHDATVQVYDDGKKLITFHNGRLFKSHLENGAWEEDELIDIHGEDGVDTHCFIADDESFIIFASDFRSHGRDLDLFVSYKQTDGTWGKAIPMDELNTEFDEDAPFLAEDSTLYFSSRGHHSLGGFDVFKSTYDKTTKKWSKPENLDFPINTVSEDIYFSIHGKVAYISSTRKGGYGSLDLYRVMMFNEFKIEGLVLNDKTKEPIPDCQIEIEYDQFYFRTYSDENGHYEMFVPVNENMVMTFNKDGKKLHQEKYYVDVFFREKDDHVYNFHVPHVVGAPTANANLEDGEEPTLIHMEMHNEFDPQSFVVSISHDKVGHWSDSLKNFYEEKHIAYLARTDKSGQSSLFFDFNSHSLSESGEHMLKQLYSSILEGGEYRVAIKGHTDTRGSHTYNKKLSLKRAHAVAKYLHRLGVKHHDVAVEGMGETDLMHHDDSETAHAKNRRAEIFYERKQQ